MLTGIIEDKTFIHSSMLPWAVGILKNYQRNYTICRTFALRLMKRGNVLSYLTLNFMDVFMDLHIIKIENISLSLKLPLLKIIGKPTDKLDFQIKKIIIF